MATFINHYSFLIAAIAAVIILSVILLRDGVQQNDLLALAALVIGLGFAFINFNAGSSDVSAIDEFDSSLAAGDYVLLELQSPYCLACATAKPLVDRLEANQPELRVVRVNIQDPLGAQLARRYGTRVTPTFLLFDPGGNLALQTVGAVDPQAIARELES